jgi:pimeloyl-ACP methyl ester carboxylesterase
MNSVARYVALALAAAATGISIAQETASGPATALALAQSKAVLREAEIVKRYPPPGRMIEVGGRKLHLLCKGPEKGPVVIIETGAFGSSPFYWKAQDEVARIARVCTYDRAGLGWSDAAPLPRSFAARVDDLHALLTRSGLKPPFILMGHSFGGLLVRMYASDHPANVGGLILVEASNEKANSTEAARQRTTQTAAQLGMAIQALAAGSDIPALRIPGGPPEQEIIQREGVFRAGQDDLLTMSRFNEEFARFGTLAPLGDTPLIVMTRGKPDPGMTDEQNQEWADSHAWLATLSTKSILMVAENSGHNVNMERPELYREAVAKMLEMKKGG